MSSGKLLTGAFIGATAGLVLGILFAPDKGLETRAKLLKKGSDFKKKVMDKKNTVADNLSNKYDKIESDMGNADQGQKDEFSAMNEDVKHSFS